MKYTIAIAALFALITSIIGTTTSMNMPIFAQNENEAEIEADIEQENKCKKDTECENENEINNSLTITNITQAQQQEEPQTQLNVVKTVICTAETAVGVSQLNGICDEVNPEDFEITVNGNNPNPSQFPGSESGTLVTLGAGSYTVSETPFLNTEVTFSGDCTQTGPFEAEGTISDGETQSCTIENEVTFIED